MCYVNLVLVVMFVQALENLWSATGWDVALLDLDGKRPVWKLGAVERRTLPINLIRPPGAESQG
jgi:hypothetical protein